MLHGLLGMISEQAASYQLLLTRPLPLPPGPKFQLLLLQYAASTTAGASSGDLDTTTAATRRKRQGRHSTLFSSSSSSSSLPPSPSEPSPEGLILVGSKLDGAANVTGDGIGGGVGGVSNLLIVPPRGSTEGGGGGGVAAGWVGSSGRGGRSGGGIQGTLGEKVVARALECLEGLCGSEECERYMTPLAREVRFSLVPKKLTRSALAIGRAGL